MDAQAVVPTIEMWLGQLKSVTKEQLDQQPYAGVRRALFERVFEEGGLSAIGDIVTLDRIARIAWLSDCERHYPDYIERLADHRANVADVHAKFAAVLDLSVSIRDVLYGMLDSWRILAAPIGRTIDVAAQQELQTARSANCRPSERLARFFASYWDVLKRAGAADAVPIIEAAVDMALGAYRRQAEQFVTAALFYDPNADIGCFHRIRMSLTPSNRFDVGTPVEAWPEMKRAAYEAFRYAFTSAKARTDHYLVTWSIDELREFEGESIGLALAIGLLARLYDEEVDGYTAFTGRVLFETGRLGAVGHIPAKLLAAKEAGFRRVYLPRDCVTEEVRGLETETFKVIGVDTVEEVWESLSSSASATPRGTSLATLIREFELECGSAHIQVIGRVRQEHDGQWSTTYVSVTDGMDTGRVAIYDSRRGVTATLETKPAVPLRMTLEGIKERVFGPGSRKASPDKSKPQSYKAYPPKRERILARLREIGHVQAKQEANCEYRLDFADLGERVIVKQYLNGNLTVQQVASGPEGDPLFAAICDCIEALLAVKPREQGAALPPPGQLQVLSVPTLTPAPNPMRTGEPWIGTDESGKGDYFGPLVCAAVCVDEHTANTLQALGVRDSKALTDARARQLAERIRSLCRGRFVEVEIGPEKYNQLYDEFRAEGKNLTLLLSWGHARALENLLQHTDARRIIVDQYADERYLRQKLLERGREDSREFQLMPRAEADPAVAAASILARDRFLSWLERESQRYGVTLPKGASENVVRVARDIVAQHGTDELRRIAKLHFRTTEAVVGAR
jgi:ribonuclease HIII